MKDLPNQMRRINQKAEYQDREKADKKQHLDTKSYEEEYQEQTNRNKKKKLIKEAKRLEKMEQVAHPKTLEEREKTYRRTVPVLRKRSHRTFQKRS